MMNFIPCDKKAIATVKNIRSDNFTLLTNFADSGLECAQIEGYPHKSAQGCASALRAAIKTYRIFTVSVAVRKNNVYLIRNSIGEKH